MNHLDQLVRDALAERAESAPAAAPVIARAVDDPHHPHRRRLTLVAAAVGTVAASAAAVAAAVAWQSEPETTPVADAPAGAGAGVLERCLELGADALPAEHWGAGSRVLTSAADGDKARAALVSADRTQWADCQLLSPGTDQGIVTTYPMAPPEPGATEFGYSSSPSDFTMLERFPENVAEVRLVFASGTELTAEAVDGFVAFQVEDAPGVGSAEGFTLLQYDAAGTLVGGPRLASGDADLPPEQRSLVPAEPIDSVEKVDNQ